jgi:transcriptional regulator with XRE-family HTH domain
MRCYRRWIFGRWVNHSTGMKEKSALSLKIGAEVRRIRHTQGRSQEDFADDCEINRTYMGNIERGEKVISVNMIKRVVTGLGLSLSEFFKGIGE